MTKNRQNLIDRKLVHKDTEDNVFLYNLRREIPHFIKADVYESITNRISIEKKGVLDRSYKRILSDIIPFFEYSSEEYYMLSSIVAEINEDQINEIADTKSYQDQAFLFLLYEPDNNNRKLHLFRDISEEEEKQILNILGAKEKEISNDIRTQISEIFEEFSEIEKSSIVYTNMYVNINHDFFFEHSNDHVPGFMLIETFRQFCVSVNHVFGKVPVQEAQLVLECLDSKFFKYAELSLPIILKGYIKECVWNRKGYWSYLDFEAEVIQNNTVLASFRLYGKIISQGVFRKIRNSEIDKLVRKFRYKPVLDISNRFTIKRNSDKQYLDVKLKNISLEGFMLQGDCFLEEESADYYNFSIYFENIGFICGECEKIWMDTESKLAGLRITEIDNQDKKRLKEAIVKYCYVYERGQIL